MFFQRVALALCLVTIAFAQTELEPSAYVCKSFKVCDASSSWGVADAFDMLQPLLGSLDISPANKFVEVSTSASRFVSESCSCPAPIEVKVKIPVYQQAMVDTISTLVDDYMEKSIAPGLKDLPQAGCWAETTAQFAIQSPMCIKPKASAAPQGSVCKKLTFCQDDTDIDAAKEQVTASVQPLFDLINLPAGRFLEFTSLSSSCLSDQCCCATPLEVSLRLPVLEDAAVEDVTDLVDSWVSDNLGDPAESNSVCIKTKSVSKFVEGSTCSPRVAAFASVANATNTTTSSTGTTTTCYCSPPAAARYGAAPPAGYGYGYGAQASRYGVTAYSGAAPTYSTAAADCYCTTTTATTAASAPASTPPPAAGRYGAMMPPPAYYTTQARSSAPPPAGSRYGFGYGYGYSYGYNLAPPPARGTYAPPTTTTAQRASPSYSAPPPAYYAIQTPPAAARAAGPGSYTPPPAAARYGYYSPPTTAQRASPSYSAPPPAYYGYFQVPPAAARAAPGFSNAPPPAYYGYFSAPPTAARASPGYAGTPPPAARTTAGYVATPPAAARAYGYSYGYGYGYGYGYSTPPAAGSYSATRATVRSANAATTTATCYCKYDSAAGSFDLSAPICKSSLYSKCAGGSMLSCSTLDSYYTTNDLAGKQAIAEFLFEDCPPEAPCACAGVAFKANETAAAKPACCANLRVACQPLFSGLACAEVEAFCTDNLASPILDKFVATKLVGQTCEAGSSYATATAAQAAPASAGSGLSGAQVAGIVVGVVVGLAVLAGVAYSALKAAQAPAAAAAAPLLAAPGSAATSGPQLLGISS